VFVTYLYVRVTHSFDCGTSSWDLFMGLMHLFYVFFGGFSLTCVGNCFECVGDLFMLW